MTALLLAIGMHWDVRPDVPVNPKAGESLEVAFPQLSAGTLIGTVELGEAWIDARGSRVPAAKYAVRYALRPNDGNHMGVSEYRDFLVLVPLADDPGPDAKPSFDAMMALGKKSTGGGHPAVMALVPASGADATITVGNLPVGVVLTFEGDP
ncbi:MAG TPA: hypothetical protein VF139_06795 [Candidatus Polarisedimenticolaceae bacterium]